MSEQTQPIMPEPEPPALHAERTPPPADVHGAQGAGRGGSQDTTAVADAYVVLGLDPAADADLIELAYWRHVEVCRASLLGGPAWRARMAELNSARGLLTAAARQRALAGSEAPPPGAPAPPHRQRHAAVAPALAGAAALLFVGGARAAGWDWGAIAAGGLGTLAAVTFAGVAAAVLFERRPPTPSAPDLDPYVLLRVHPAADQELITVSYRHLLRGAAAAGDDNVLDALERAYARIGTPTARAAYDLRASAIAAARADDGDGRVTAAPAAAVPVVNRLPAPAGPSTPMPVPAPPAAARPRRLLPGRRSGQPGNRPRPEARWGPEHEGPAPGYDVLRAEAGSSARGRAGARAVGTLEVNEGAREVVTLVLRDATVYTIGAGAHCDVRLPEVSDAEGGAVAPEHARITVRRGRVMFHHIDPNAASLVNGERAVWLLLEPGDDLSIGPYTCRFVAAVGGDPPDTAADAGATR